MNFITHKELKQMLIKASEQVSKHKTYINDVNFFPIPDCDTGSNLDNTLLAVKNVLVEKDFKDITSLSHNVLQSILNSSQGNSGIILSAFINGMFSELKENKKIDVRVLAQAFTSGKKSASESIQDPQLGTMLDVIECLSIYFIHTQEEEKNIEVLFHNVLPLLKKKVYETEGKMKILKENQVVDAGAVGFYFVIKGFSIALGNNEDQNADQFANKRKEIRPYKTDIVDHVFEVIAILSDVTMETSQIREILSGLGNCLDTIEIENQLKIHIHTDVYEQVMKTINMCGTVKSQQIIDMRTNEKKFI